MDNSKLQAIIGRKNDQLERHALEEAAGIIDAITNRQLLIVRAQSDIKELREKLTALEIEQLDAASILGGEAS